ncbi:MAG TPA: permease [Acidimicrobiales bacterium]|nr:permease [Acidimicrobiales bacterium]
MTFAVTAGGALVDIGRSLREAFFMFWETLWPLVLGFGASGAVQAFVSRGALRRRLGNHGPGALARASVFGMVSSSCSYAASAMAKSLFAKGADFVATLVFMVASTNLVIELGLVMLVLIGWQFAVSEFVGGVIMIVLLASMGGLWFRGASVAAARARLQVDSATGGEPGSGSSELTERQPWTHALRSRTGWVSSATFTMSDLTMLRRELVIGYTVAGFLATLVPSHFWQSLFLAGHGDWTSVENVVVGPFVAMVSFVCSIGNVPLAAALWKGGISFGGVIAFVFADLITVPLLSIYRRYYGWRLTVRMTALLWFVMSVAGLATEWTFRALGLVPTMHPVMIASDRLSWNYTTFLNLVSIFMFVALYVLYRNRHRWGPSELTIDPVCGMPVRKSEAALSLAQGGEHVYFCSDRCKGRYVLHHSQGTAGTLRT